ncbi:ferritin-like superfamily [Mycena rebaudengoi]|nr:ferritin-like superfamily [Mycena rebaudengoi]
MTAPEKRYVLYPIQRPQLWDMYKVAEENFWTAEQHSLSTASMPSSDKVRNAIQKLLASAIVQCDDRFLDPISIATDVLEAKTFLGYQAAMRNIHVEAYANILDRFSGHQPDITRPCSIRDTLIQEAEIEEVYRARYAWLHSIMSASDENILQRLTVGICAESICSSSFSLALALTTDIDLPELRALIDIIEGDRKRTTEFLTHLFLSYAGHDAPASVSAIVHKALEFERASIQELPYTDILGLNMDKLDQQLRDVAQKLLRDLYLSTPKSDELMTHTVYKPRRGVSVTTDNRRFAMHEDF